MPLIRCPKCGQAYDIPGVIAIRLPNAIATCHCGEWLAGSKAAVLARMLRPDDIKEIDLQPYRVEGPGVADVMPIPEPKKSEPLEVSMPRSVHVVARGPRETVDTIFTIHEHPLWIGRKGCHVELGESELSLRHCSISVRGSDLVLRDADSHTGTFLDGQSIDEAILGDGVHIVRAGTALVSIEAVDEPGTPVEPIRIETDALDGALFAQKLQQRARESQAAAPSRTVLVCIAGALEGQEFEIPASGLVVGREGHVRVPDEFLSRRHFEVVPDADGTLHVRDLGSRNGTFLNTLPARNTRVHGGDEIQAGNNRFRIEQRQ